MRPTEHIEGGTIVCTDFANVCVPPGVAEWFKSLPRNKRGEANTRTKRAGRKLMGATVMQMAETLWKQGYTI